MLRALIFIAIFLQYVEAREAIESFNSDIDILKNGRMIVTETIKVHSDGFNIKTGIYRDYPNSYTPKGGRNRRIGFDLIQVLRDGEKIPHSVKRIPGYRRIIMGDLDKKIPRGDYTYTLQYETCNHFHLDNDSDQLFYDITGHDWDLSILSSSITLRVPPDIDITNVQGQVLVGKVGSGQIYFASLRDDHTYVKKIGQTLHSGEGVTINFKFPKLSFQTGFMNYRIPLFGMEITPFEVTVYGAVFIFIFFNFVLLYNLIATRIVSESESKLDHPPENCSPGLARYLGRIKFDKKILSCALVSMATKGFLSFEKVNEGYSIIKLKTADKKILSKDEKSVAKHLVSNKKITLSAINFNKIKNTLAELEKDLRESATEIYFKKRSVTSGVALFLTIAYSLACLYVGYASFSLLPLVGMLFTIPGYLLYKRFFIETTKAGLESKRSIHQFKRYMLFSALTAAPIQPDTLTSTYEHLLPYAIAFGIEKKWDRLFTQRVTVESDKTPLNLDSYIPSWYASGFNAGAGAFWGGAISRDLGYSLFNSSTSSIGGGSGGAGGGSGGSGGGGGGTGGGGGGGC